MSAVAVVTPMVIANWPIIVGVATSALTTLGYTVVEAAANTSVNTRVTNKNRVEVEVDESAVVEGFIQNETIIAIKDGVTATISMDAHGRLKVCVEGEEVSKAQLRAMADELVGSMTQQYVYNKLMSEIENRNLTLVEEEVAEDRTIKIRLRNS